MAISLIFDKFALAKLMTIEMTKNSDRKLAFGKRNFQIMILGVVVLFIGFIIMASDSEPFGFGFMGLTLGPIIVFAGFMIQFFALLHKPKD